MLDCKDLKFKIMTPLLCEEYIKKAWEAEASEESGRARKLVLRA